MLALCDCLLLLSEYVNCVCIVCSIKSGKLDIWNLFTTYNANSETHCQNREYIANHCEIGNVLLNIDRNILFRLSKKANDKNHFFVLKLQLNSFVVEMSMLERLTVRGIRNFGVDAEDEQVWKR